MNRYEIILSAAFQKQLKKLIKKSPRIKPKVTKILKILAANINHPSLRLHKLSGENNWSVSVTGDIRIIMHFSQSKLYLTRIGSHDDVY